MRQQIEDMIRRIYPQIDHDERITENIIVYIENNPGLFQEYHVFCDE